MITNTPATGRITDEPALDNIATLLGTSPEWQSAADYLDHIADTIATTGRPHPGDQDPDQYQQLLAQHTKTRQLNTTQLNELLAEYTDWAHTREQLSGREEAGTPVYADEWHDSDDTAVGILQDLVTAITTGHTTERTAGVLDQRCPACDAAVGEPCHPLCIGVAAFNEAATETVQPAIHGQEVL